MLVARLGMLTFFVSQVSELAEEQELRDMFERFGRVTRVFLAKDRETNMAKGFAFISFADRTDASRACEKMDGCKFRVKPFSLFSASLSFLLTYSPVGYRHLILRVEFAKKTT
jgi:translation initiation factor 3 subunit G